MKRVIAVIPARFGAQRFPGKPLALVAGIPLVVRVLRQVQKARAFSAVLVASDDERILSVVREHGAEGVLTPAALPSGTDRVWEAVRHRNADIVVNIQGDEPLIDPALLEDLAYYLAEHPEVPIASAVFPLSPDRAQDPNIVKAVRNDEGFALYFSRSPIPYRRNPESGLPFLKHLGVYGYQKEALERLTGLPQHPLERAEGLEQLRALAAGMSIALLMSTSDSAGVDTPEDVLRVEALLRQSEENSRPI